MAQKIIGLDIGAWAIKAVVLDISQKPQVTQLEYERIVTQAPSSVAPPPIPGEPVVPEEAAADEATGQWEALTEGVMVEDVPEEVTLEPWQLAVQRIMARIEIDQETAIVTSMPGQKAVGIQIQDLMFGDRNKVGKILPSQLSEKLPIGLDEIVYDFDLMERGKDNYEALVGFTKRDDLAIFLGQLDQIGVDPMSVGLPEMMMRYLAPVVGDGTESSYAILDLGHESSKLTVMHQGQLLLARSIAVGGLDITENIEDVFKAPRADVERVKHQQAKILEHPSEDPNVQALNNAITTAVGPLVRDLRRTFQSLYANQGFEVDTIYLTGSSSQVRRLPDYLKSQLGVLSVTMLDVWNSLDVVPQVTQGHVYDYNSALAMTLQQVEDRSNQTIINLRQGDYAWRGQSAFVQKKLRNLGIAALIMGLLLGFGLFMQYRDLQTRHDAMRTQLAQETRKVFSKPLYKAKDIRKTIGSDSASDGSFAKKSSAFEMMFKTIKTIDKLTELKLTRLDVDVGRNLVQMRGETTTPQDVDSIVSDLEQIKCFKNIKREKVQVRSETKATFRLNIQSECS